MEYVTMQRNFNVSRYIFNLAALLLLCEVLVVGRSLAAGTGICPDDISSDDSHEIYQSIECFTDSVHVTLTASSSQLLMYTFSTEACCTTPNGTQVTYSLHTNVYYGVNDDNLEETVNHGLPAGSECTSIGCYRDSHRYSLHNKSCTIPPPSPSTSPSLSLPPSPSLSSQESTVPLSSTSSSFPSSSPAVISPLSSYAPSLSSSAPSLFSFPPSHTPLPPHPTLSHSSSQMTTTLTPLPSNPPTVHTASYPTRLAVVLTVTITVGLLVILCLSVAVLQYQSRTNRVLKVGQDNWKRESVHSDYSPLDLNQQFLPTFTSQQSIINSLCDYTYSTSSTAKCDTSHHDSYTTTFRQTLRPPYWKSASADYLMSSSGAYTANTSGYSTGWNSDNGLAALPQTSLVFPCCSNEGIPSRRVDDALDLEVTDANAQDAQVAPYSLGATTPATLTCVPDGPVTACLTHHHTLDTSLYTRNDPGLGTNLARYTVDSEKDTSKLSPLSPRTTGPRADGVGSSSDMSSGDSNTDNCECRYAKTFCEPPTNTLECSTPSHTSPKIELTRSCSWACLSSTGSSDSPTNVETKKQDGPSTLPLDAAANVVVRRNGLNHYDRAASSSSGSWSLTDYAGYVHIETPLK